MAMSREQPRSVKWSRQNYSEPDDAIDAFLQQDPEEGLAVSTPEANAYEFQSGGVVAMFEKLFDKFIEERTTLENEEVNSKQACI